MDFEIFNSIWQKYKKEHNDLSRLALGESESIGLERKSEKEYSVNSIRFWTCYEPYGTDLFIHKR